MDRWHRWANEWFPAFGWAKNLRKEDAKWDVMAGTSVAIMLVPQAMAYAMLAGLPPVVGLYASTLPLIGYALLGSSRHLAVGPVAIISLMVAVACGTFAEPGTTEYVTLAAFLALFVGAIQLVLGLLRAGFVANFFSHAVVSGFTSAAAIIIAVSQLKYLLGIELVSHSNVFITLYSVFEKIGETNLVTLSLGVTAHLFLVLLKKRWPTLPGALFVVLAGCLAAYLFNLQQVGVQIVGEVPKGLPGFSIPQFDFATLITLFPAALAIAFVGFAESIAIAEYVASKVKYKVNSNQEFRGLALANILAGIFSGYPVTGGFSRTAVNYQAGARTRLSGLVSGVVVLLTLFLLTPLFYYLPKVILASIIMAAVVGLVDYKEAVRLMRLKRADGMTLVLTFLFTLLAGIEVGILFGIVFSLGLFIWRSAHPHIAELGYLEKEDIFRSLNRYSQAKELPKVVMIRVDASMYFANMGFIGDYIQDRIQCHPDVKWVIFDLSGVNDIDAVAISHLGELIENYRSRGIEFALAAMKGPVRDLVNKEGWKEKYGRAIAYPDIRRALEGISAMNAKGDSSL